MLNQFKRKKTPLTSFLWVFNTIALVVLVLWLIVSNLIIGKYEPPLLQRREAVIEQYPLPPHPELAIPLEQMFSTVSQEVSKQCGERWTDLVDLDKITDTERSIPECLTTIFENQSTSLDILIQYLLNNPIPPRYYETVANSYEDLRKLFDNPASYVFSINFGTAISQHILFLLYGLRQSQIGQPEAALNTFSANWKLSRSLLDFPTLFSSLIHINNLNYEAQVMRSINQLPENWIQYFPLYDLRQPFFNGILTEIFSNFAFIKAYPIKKTKLFNELDHQEDASSPILVQLFSKFQQPYFTLSAIDYEQKSIQANEILLHQQDFCDLKEEKSQVSFAAWNIIGNLAGNYSNHWRKLGKAQLNWELTQKVLALKNIVRKAGEFPKAYPALTPSSVCPSQRWHYQISPDGKTATIALDNPPEWLVTKNRPFTYTIVLSSVLGQS